MIERGGNGRTTKRVSLTFWRRGSRAQPRAQEDDQGGYDLGLLKWIGVAAGVAVLGPIALAAVIPGGSLNNMCGIDGACDDDC